MRAMANTARPQQPTRYIAIHERSPNMTLLYVSSSIRQALLYEPSDMIGRSPPEFIIHTEDRAKYQKHHGTYTDDNVIMTDLFAKRKDNRPIFVRTIAFSCNNVDLHMSTAYPDVAIESLSERFACRSFNCILSENKTKHSTHGLYSSSDRKAISAEALRRDFEGLALSSRKRTNQTCIVLEDLHSTGNNGSHNGLRIMFVTSSIDRMLDVDSSDLQGIPFLSLVVHEDFSKAVKFLERVIYGGDLVLEHLRLLTNPLEDRSCRVPRYVSVEIMAMGSDDGAIMLCQLDQPKTKCANNTGYLSLEDIISSDPGTSDLGMG